MKNKTPLADNYALRRIKTAVLKSTTLFIIALGCFSVSSKALSDSLHLAVATNFISPIKQLALDFKKETGYSVTLSFGSSGKLFAQIKNNAPYDIFLSADLNKPQTLIVNQLAFADSLVVYAKGQLVVWSMKPLPKSTLEETLLSAKRIAIANPRLAPYGKAAKESLRHLDVWEKVQNKLVQGENIGQAYQFTYSQNAEIGLVALSQVLSGPKQGHLAPIPHELYGDINQAGVILSRTQKPVLATQFMAFLMRSDNQAKIVQFGYSIGQ